MVSECGYLTAFRDRGVMSEVSQNQRNGVDLDETEYLWLLVGCIEWRGGSSVSTWPGRP